MTKEMCQLVGLGLVFENLNLNIFATAEIQFITIKEFIICESLKSWSRVLTAAGLV